jgi:hypothetical protein
VINKSFNSFSFSLSLKSLSTLFSKSGQVKEKLVLNFRLLKQLFSRAPSHSQIHNA